MQLRDGQRQRRLQPGDAEGRALELHLFLMRRMRRVVGGNRVHRSVTQCRYDRFAVCYRTKWRIHLEVRVVLSHILVQ